MAERVALLDNTIQIDRKKSANRRDHIDRMLAEFAITVSTSICLLEFKATIIQQCITIHDALRMVGLYTRVVDYLTESSHPQAKLRNHIFRNIVNVFAPSSFDVTEECDRRLAEKARLRLESVIPRLYKWFTEQSVDAVLYRAINCTRALEPPRKKRVAFGVNLPKCERADNKSCQIEEFIREHAPPLLERLEAVLAAMPNDQAGQLRRSCALFRSVIDNPDLQLSHSECRRAGDCLIALEGSQHATDALSTNAQDWGPVSEAVDLKFVRVKYPALDEA